ncbi:MAG: ATP-binding cassette domain-containing protein [Verrucomicrobiota bacterium]
MSDALIHVLGLGVEIAGRRIIDGVSLSAARGQTVAIVGPNGAGKTTLLRAMAGLLPSDGELEVGGHDPRAIDAATCAQTRAYCAQKPVSAWDYRVSDLGEIIGHPNGYADWLTKLQLGEFSDRLLSELSGGEQKGAHLAMAFAALAEPFGGTLLLDEPAAALDLNRQEAVTQAIFAFAQAGGACVVATHDLSFAKRCDAVVVLSEGRLVAAGEPTSTLTPEIISGVWGAWASSAR